MNLRPSGYEPDELPGCSIPRHFCLGYRAERYLSPEFGLLRGALLEAGVGLPRGALLARVWPTVSSGWPEWHRTKFRVRPMPLVTCDLGLIGRPFGRIVERREGLFRSGGDLLSHVLRRSTIGATALNGRVRDGAGCFACAMATRPKKTLSLVLGTSSTCCPNLTDTHWCVCF